MWLSHFSYDKNVGACLVSIFEILYLEFTADIQGAKKVSFTACHSGKLYLACTSLKVFPTSLKKRLMHE